MRSLMLVVVVGLLGCAAEGAPCTDRPGDTPVFSCPEGTIPYCAGGTCREMPSGWKSSAHPTVCDDGEGFCDNGQPVVCGQPYDDECR